MGRPQRRRRSPASSTFSQRPTCASSSAGTTVATYAACGQLAKLEREGAGDIESLGDNVLCCEKNKLCKDEAKEAQAKRGMLPVAGLIAATTLLGIALFRVRAAR